MLSHPPSGRVPLRGSRFTERPNLWRHHQLLVCVALEVF